jgi:hypothetical protein
MLALNTPFDGPAKGQRAAHWGDARHRDALWAEKGLQPTAFVAIFPIVTFAAVEIRAMPAI